jgi:2-keto-3-deoxy-L-rhamnonate aldolase RhmA
MGSLVIENPVKRALQAGRRVFGTMVYHGAWTGVVDVLARDGYQFVVIETEHSATGSQAIDALVRSALASGIVPIVRPGQADYRLIAHAMDLGALGVMVPRVNTVEQARLVVDAVKYPPLGQRGCGGYRFDLRAEPIATQIERLNEATLVLVQVETRQALANLEGILQVPGVDGVVIGPLDLSISLGVPAQFQDPSLEAALLRVVDTCRQHGAAAGIHLGDPAALSTWAERGMQFLMCSSDFGMLAQRSAEMAGSLRALVACEP